MKTFTKQEILELYGQVTLGEISFSQMVEIMNKRVSEADKPCVEDIPVRKFKKGDKVVLKSGYKKSDGLLYLTDFDRFIGNPLTIRGYTDTECVHFSDCPYIFEEEWLEPYEGLKKGDLAILWDDSKKYAIIRFYDRPDESEKCLRHKDNIEFSWANAIKFESKEQYERLINGEI